MKFSMPVFALISLTPFCGISTGTERAAARYSIEMSEDDAICKPLLHAYNKKISLDFPKSVNPHRYPWPSPSELSVTWRPVQWRALASNERSMKDAYSIVELDLDSNNSLETIVRTATWIRGDDRFTSLEVFPKGTLLPNQMSEYEIVRFKSVVAKLAPGTYRFPKLHGRVPPTSLNDFDVIGFKGRHYITARTAVLNGIREVMDVQRWRVVGTVRLGNPPERSESDLDWVLNSICYLRMNLARQ